MMHLGQRALLEFVKEKHGEQKRKYTHEPYWKHCYNVGSLVHSITNKNLLMEIGFCHDLFEDTECTPVELKAQLLKLEYKRFESDEIVQGVIDLTDVYTKDNYPTMNRSERKLNEAKRLATIYPEYQSVKLADLIDNSSTIVEYDKKFAVVYIKEKIQILDYMRNGNINLFIECCSIIHDARKELEI